MSSPTPDDGSSPALAAADDSDHARNHELAMFLKQDAEEMQSEYQRIRSISAEDPGTAGDEGEEAWAELLRRWLPESYRVITKGRLLAADGRRSPQIDVIVLRPGYPKRLLSKKVFMIGGVAAAFECKNTLKAEHITRAFEQAHAIERLSPARTSSPFHSMVPQVLFGLLAHSTVWTSSESQVKERIDRALHNGLQGLDGFRGALGLLCVADLECWSLGHQTFYGPGLMQDWEAVRQQFGLPPEGVSITSYYRFPEGEPPQHAAPNALAAAIALILGRLAHEDVSVRPLSQYFFAAGMQGSGASVASQFVALSHFDPEVRANLPGRLTNGVAGSDWAMFYNF